MYLLHDSILEQLILLKLLELPQMEIVATAIQQHAREEHRFGNLTVTNVSAEGKTHIPNYLGHNFQCFLFFPFKQ